MLSERNLINRTMILMHLMNRNGVLVQFMP